MKILSYSYSDYPINGWKVPIIDFNNLNLIVGISGAGKTKLMDSIINIKNVVNNGFSNSTIGGAWKTILNENDKKFHWEITVSKYLQNKVKVLRETLSMEDGNSKIKIVERDKNTFTFNGQKLPKLSDTESALSLLKNESIISDLFKGFGHFLKRDLSITSLKEAATTHMITFKEKESLKKEKNIYHVINIEGLNDKLDVLHKSFNDIFENICHYFLSIFPFIKRVDIKKQESPFGLVPIFCIKERNIDNWIPLSELSSGMQKIIFMLTDICSLPEGSVYFIDEYENSLGINAINIIPEILIEYNNKIQFFITSHHPYLINNIPVKNWYVCYRSGQNVNVKYGKELEERYGPSKQKAFINLMNDPIYSEGIE